MKLIIDIPETPLYKDICENGYIYDEDNEYIAKIIKDGIPLPTCKTCQEWNTNKSIAGACYCCNWHNYTGEDFYCGDWVRKTIIEADKENKE